MNIGNRIGKEEIVFIFKISVELHGTSLTSIIDSTVKETTITFPIDAKLAIKITLGAMKKLRVILN